VDSCPITNNHACQMDWDSHPGAHTVHSIKFRIHAILRIGFDQRILRRSLRLLRLWSRTCEPLRVDHRVCSQHGWFVPYLLDVQRSYLFC
jgi:hypothetical protein